MKTRRLTPDSVRPSPDGRGYTFFAVPSPIRRGVRGEACRFRHIALMVLCLWFGASMSAAELKEAEPPFEMVGQEIDPLLLDNLPEPTEPPARVQLHSRIGKDQWQGSQSGITTPSQGVFRRQAYWEKFWTLAIHPYNPRMPKTPPVIDFEKNMVVGIFMGSKPHPGFQIDIRSVETRPLGAQHVLNVKYKNITKMESVFTPPFVVQPFHLRVVPAFSGVAEFEEEK
jgi:hypothetical protein